MEYVVVLAEVAKRDLDNIYEYIAIDCLEPIYAGNLVNKIKNAARSLSTLPYRHPLCQIATNREARKFVVGGYNLFYVVDDKKKTVTIIRIASSRRDFVNTNIRN